MIATDMVIIGAVFLLKWQINGAQKDMKITKIQKRAQTKPTKLKVAIRG